MAATTRSPLDTEEEDQDAEELSYTHRQLDRRMGHRDRTGHR